MLIFVQFWNTRVTEDNSKMILQQFFSSWRFIGNYSYARLGRIWILIKPNLSWMVTLQSAWFTNISVVDPPCLISFVYSSNSELERGLMYSMFAGFCPTLVPLMVLGDFNAVLGPQDSSNVVSSQSSTDDFRKWSEDMELVEHISVGSWFTWTNKQDDRPIARRLDRVFINEAWVDSFPRSYLQILLPGVSDHCSLFLNSDVPLQSLPKPFKYYKFWCEHPTFYNLIDEAWSLKCSGSPLWCVSRKLRCLKGLLRKLNRDHYSDISNRVREAEADLALVQEDALANPSSDSFRNEAECMSKFLACKKVEEEFYRLKSRILNVACGDQNTQYFHKSVKMRQHRATIKSMIGDDGDTATDIHDIAKIAVDFYQKLLGKVNVEVMSVPPEDILSGLIEKKVTATQQFDLCKPVTRDEVRSAFFSMNGDKAPGPDGFTADFFKVAWNIIGEEIFMAMDYFFQGGVIPPECLQIAMGSSCESYLERALSSYVCG
ncbi:Transposon TX1 uncharacterized 149 kDa protein [Linum perenne]